MSVSEVRMFDARVQNVPVDTRIRKYVVARVSTDGLWFYASYEDEGAAQIVATDIGNGIVLLNPDSSQ